jgi:hypothetical protein
MAKLPEYDAVAIHQLSAETQHAISEALEESGWDVGKSWIDLPTCAAIFFLLKYSPDDPELFPKGKWATLQRLEVLIENAIVNTNAAGNEPPEARRKRLGIRPDRVGDPSAPDAKDGSALGQGGKP